MLGLLLKIDWSVMFSWPEFWAWAEVWALFIPLAVYLARRKGFPRLLKPVLYYVFIALFLNSLSDFSWRMQIRLNLPPWASNNIPIYHLNFILRLLLFAWFFNLLNEPFLKNIKKILPWLFLVFVVILFTIIRPIKSFVFEYNSVLNAVEAAILLFYCLQHYVYRAQAEQIPYTHNRSVNWIVAGLTLYVGVNFFIFLSYSTLIKLSHDFSIVIWDVHNASYVILCCLIAKGFYESNRP
jgi:hypothetical protein